MQLITNDGLWSLKLIWCSLYERAAIIQLNTVVLKADLHLIGSAIEAALFLLCHGTLLLETYLLISTSKLIS